MVGQLSLTIISVIINIEYARGDNLWCFDCNTDLSNGHTRECNDPYIPAPYYDLVLCPQNESQHCLKGVIEYRDILVTVRGCVPSREIDGYCKHEKYFPESNIVCSFCNDYACNSQQSLYLFIPHSLLVYLSLVFLLLYIK
ncbi:uncharacterized protein LOC100881346 isoform X2 [Megachile rotundata]|uniref:uncharacterized protein LOC100881346 isoform X2 n=1 Tax=Megachile rotundata TaxID=143995 RepID=UPI000258DA72|nr:PREDICTED: uncharacterized protein LOC100881346 isoform X2 [Megachile rotundata]XP_012135392.1 PREDICTED: uncharacterized protein LOC100881346 isoform X3 [Megachile rotundata]